MTEKPPIILVHGAWANAKGWDVVANILRDKGHKVAAIDLPGHGEDAASPQSVGLADYARRIAETLEARGPAVLVGHGLGGIAISAGAELVPNNVQMLVFVAGLLPLTGQSQSEILKQQEAPGIQPAILPATKFGVCELNRDLAGDILFQDASPEIRATGLDQLDLQPAQALTDQPILTQDRFGRIPRAYVVCEQDRAVTPELQRKMIAGSPYTQAFSMDSGHFPQLTQPGALADILTNL